MCDFFYDFEVGSVDIVIVGVEDVYVRGVFSVWGFVFLFGFW